MKTIEINEIKTLIDSTPVEMNLMFIGGTGIGKTSVIKQYAKEHNSFLKTLILSTIEASECLGIPVPTTREFQGKEYTCLKTAIPEWVFELKEHEDNAILFLDEFFCAQPSVMNSFLNFLSEKIVEGIDLRKIRIIAATNIGNYTFNPDNNIRTRFCFFYTVNTTAKDFVRPEKERIRFEYVDENPKVGSIFEPMALVPRCYEMLNKIKDDKVMYMCYEGYTNTKYFRVHEDDVINDLLMPYFVINEDNNLGSLSNTNCLCVVSILKGKYPRTRSWDPIISKFQNIDIEAIEKIKAKLGMKQ